MSEKRSFNIPLSHAEMKRLPIGFTPTSFGFTGQQIKKLSRQSPHSLTNRKTTPGRILQWIPIWYTTENFEMKLYYKQIWHKKSPYIPGTKPDTKTNEDTD